MLSLPKQKEYFVFIQVETNKIASDTFRFNERSHDGALYKTKHSDGDFRAADQVWGGLKTHLEDAQKITGSRIILGFHSGLCTTTETVITLRRDRPRELVDEAELENLISSSLWRVLSRDREKLAKKMNTTEAAVTLVGALMKKIRVDGHRVASPVGFSAHTIEFTIAYTVCSRSLYDVLVPFLMGEREIYVTEIGMSELFQLASGRDVAPFLFVRVSETYTYMYACMDGELGYRDTITWGRRSLIGALVNELFISEPQAAHILSLIDKGLTSSHVKRRVESLLFQEVAVLFKSIGSHVDEGKYARVYISAPFSLPAALFNQAVTRRSGIAIAVMPMPTNSHGAKTESALTLEAGTGASSLASLCANASVAQQFFVPSEINAIVKRRARWLVAASAKSVS